MMECGDIRTTPGTASDMMTDWNAQLLKTAHATGRHGTSGTTPENDACDGMTPGNGHMVGRPGTPGRHREGGRDDL